MFSGIKGPNPSDLKGPELRILIVHARWNLQAIEPLVKGAVETMIEKHDVKLENIDIESVPGSYELPQGIRASIARNTYDAVIGIGVLIKGSTMHFEYISEAVVHGLMRVGLDSGVPVIFGLLTVLNEEQALYRAGLNGGHNHGNDWGSAAVEMGLKALY
uniref:6,7-Dimethyl-8-ribityllumazine Synthase n=1 Tax=Schizosaccharomyces pombe TaxID=4896 RepID=UPI00001122B6|nr:Chain A, 6,7-Dimethyl-8-ribityllumazine Synthase [Schizosaccharomyces pombe]1KZ6_B Chain B, 6,7-Dimethyl-8-ribityllumazine Synthase [Schizosaccharomyces pombe]1KZ6_C Chain C, 6,7-Dimethyl-8-ribityllumazine Synthase [Schizosaccharomyces pombe]1KZ6_D Chain D, 6,7-Dimethyl-8-ribityllumazine Synthase [Schizosaccharomyces pombe]1KZ6_E Chain E, 6,7-Dimethyl-8-ribityllumazine Synthase [Schizosaccharomyces pombe]